MNEDNNYQLQSHDESTLQAAPWLVPGLLARLGLDDSPRAFDSSPESLSKAMFDPAWTVRATAIEALANLSDQQSLQWLLAALHDEDESVRACAVRVLGRRGEADSTVIEQLEAALRDPAWHVRETAIYALGMIQSFASLPALKAALDDEDTQVRLAATLLIERLESVASNEQQENVIHRTTEVAQPSSAFNDVWPRWMRRAATFPVHRTHSENEKELSVIEENQDVADQHAPGASEATEGLRKHVSTRPTRPHRPWLRVLEQVMAAILVLGIAVSWFAISHLSHLSSGTSGVFNDANARPLGAPTYTIRGNLSYLEQWSNDGHTFYYLQVDTKKQTLHVSALNAATGHTSTYSVLDSSWINSLHQFNIDIVDHYLLALRPQGKNTATMEIWDITGQRAITTQTVPATVVVNGQIVSPLLVPSENGQKLAIFPPDGKITIWNIASGQKLATFEGTSPYVNGPPPTIKWYDHDQYLLFLNRSNANGMVDPSGPLEAWNTATGLRLFKLQDTTARYFEASVSPDGNVIALSTGSRQPSGTSSTNISPTTLEILNAHSGQVLHTYHLNGSNTVAVSYYWLSDSQRLLIVYMPVNSPQAKAHIHVINIFDGQTTFDTFSTYTGFYWVTPNSQYLLLGSLDSNNSDNSRSMQIWQTSSGRLVTTITTPGIHPNANSYFDASNQYILIGEKDTFDIWDVATGKLLFKYHGFTPFSVAGANGSNVFWSPGGKYLTMIAWQTSLMGTGSGDGVITIWRMP